MIHMPRCLVPQDHTLIHIHCHHPHLELQQLISFLSHQPNSRRQSPSHAIDPYAQMPGTPRPSSGERYSISPSSHRTSDPFSLPSGTPRPIKNEAYDQPLGTPRPVLTDPYSQSLEPHVQELTQEPSLDQIQE